MAELVKRLNKGGIQVFRTFLQQLRDNGAAETPRYLLTDPASTNEVEPEVVVTERSFADRMDAARYLSGVVETLSTVEEDVGLWSWLSLYYFDQVCPPKPNRGRCPGRDYRHILEAGFPHGPRHLLAGAVLVYRLYGEDAPLLLGTGIHEENGFHHEVTSRQAFISNPNIVRAVHLLYWDEDKRRSKRGAQQTGQQPGTLRRFVDVVQQLDLNYDLYSMAPEEILELLPAEFDSWKPSRSFLLRRRRAAKSSA